MRDGFHPPCDVSHSHPLQRPGQRLQRLGVDRGSDPCRRGLAGGKHAKSVHAGLLPDGDFRGGSDYRCDDERNSEQTVRGAAPAASDIEEAQELLQEHHDNIEQKIEDIDAEIAELEAKREHLVQQHPRIE